MGWITFFTSFSTLICCALPSLLVAIGAGSTLVSLITHVPWLVTLSEYKEITWTIAGVLLFINGLWMWQTRNAPCPIDPILAKKCTQARTVSRTLWIGSLAIYLVGVGWALASDWLF